MTSESRDARDSLLDVIEGLPAVGLDGRFVDLKRIDHRGGRGHFSLVFKAYDQQTRSMVALKFYDISKSEQYRLDSFNREASLLERFRGDRDIVQLVASRAVESVVLQVQGPAGFIPIPFDFPYYAVRLATGDVKSYILSDHRDPLSSLLLFHRMSRAVQRVHLKKVCHRDINPGNFLLFGRRDVRLSDFGTARCLDGSEPPLLDSYHAPPGHIYYTPPELIAGLGDCDPQFYYLGDLFGLGAILFELLTGQQLCDYLYDTSFLGNLAAVAQNVPKTNRHMVYDGFVDSIATTRRLPDIDAFGVSIPTCIFKQVNQLYKDLADLDYRRRQSHTFGSIFRRIQMCVIILRHEQEYKRLLERRREQRRRDKSNPTGINQRDLTSVQEQAK